MAKRKDLKSVALGDTRTGVTGALFPTVVVVEIQFNLVAAAVAAEQQMTG